jgi:tetratricopeptide (TPR) repeat protein
MSPLAIAFNAGSTAFARGDWAEAAKQMETAVTLLTDPKDIAKGAPVYYILGASYFNAHDYAKAVDIFTQYLTKYPKAERVGEVRLSLARATFLNKDYATAAKLFAEFEAVPALREIALQTQATCYKELNQPDKQIPVLEKLIAPEIQSSSQANGAVTLAELYIDKQDNTKALDLINKLRARLAVVDNVVALNVLTVKLGDELATNKVYGSAIAAYRSVIPRDQVIAIQNERINAMSRRMQANLDATRGNPQAYLNATGTNNDIKALQDQAKALLADFEKLPDYMPAVLFRMGKAWYDSDKKWEAIVVFERLLATVPDAKEREAAMYSTLACYADLNRASRTLNLCDRYLQEFPTGANAGTAGYLKGAVALQTGDSKSAVSFFGTALEKQPDSQFREQMRFLMGNAHFGENEFEEAGKDYRQYLIDFPKGTYAEEAQYREALTFAFLGKYEEALAKLEAYSKQYPTGNFAADAGYRILVCKYAASLYDEVIADARAWDTKYPNNPVAGEVFSLMGDALAAKDRSEEAAAAYIQSYQKSATDEVLNYAIMEAAKQLQKLGKWEEMSRLFEDFIKARPDHPTVVAAMFWISKAKAHEGKTDEAKALLVDNLKRYLNEPKREAVEQLLQQLAQLCLKRPRPAPSAVPVEASAAVPVAADNSTAGAASTPAPATPPPLPPYDAVAELRKQMEPLAGIANATGRARLLYAEAELAKLRRHEEEVPKIYDRISHEFKDEELSPVLLAQIGDYRLKTGDKDGAAALYHRLKEGYPKSDYLDYAFVGLGELALDKKDPKLALELFHHAADELAASKIKEATIGKARALLELQRYDEAKKLFEQVASIREWRGESTALAVYYLGEVEARQGRWPEAIAHYQRVFVAYQKFLPWVARAYVRSAEGFDKLGKRPEAIAHLHEMLRNERLKDLPEISEAKKLLVQWGASA